MAEETVWLTQELRGYFLKQSVAQYLANIFETGELEEKAVCRNFRRTAEDGKEYESKFYSLDVIIIGGFRVHSTWAMQFRQG